MESSFFLSFILGHFRIFQKELTYSTRWALVHVFLLCIFSTACLRSFTAQSMSSWVVSLPTESRIARLATSSSMSNANNIGEGLKTQTVHWFSVYFLYMKLFSSISYKWCVIFKKTYIVVTYFEHDKLLPHWLVHVYNVIGPQILQHMW